MAALLVFLAGCQPAGLTTTTPKAKPSTPAVTVTGGSPTPAPSTAATPSPTPTPRSTPPATGAATPSPTPVALPSVTHYPVPFKVQDGRLASFDGTRYKPVFLAGINVGVGLPGTSPGELAPTKEQYLRWFERMSEIGVNCIRLYTLNQPHCYQALAEHNARHQDRPLYLLQGIWLDEGAAGGDLTLMTDTYDENSRLAINALHGQATIPQKPGLAYGTYTADVSPYVLAWLIGRELQPDEVLATNELHADMTSFTGAALALPAGTPTEAWLTARMDHILVLENQLFQTKRPIGFSSWPTLDPLVHPGEVVPQSYEDAASVDLANVQLVDAPGGVFASFHAYPYYPNFMTEQASYASGSDAQGPNAYVAYLKELVAHYKPMPVVIGEFGTPSSWGNAHDGAGGMSHGNRDEVQQGNDDARLLGDIHDVGAAGAIMFSWIDEWWKRTWITDPVALPRERYPLWHNMTSPEQNFGLIAFDPPAPDMNAWSGATGTGRIRRVRAAADVSYMHVDLELASPLTDAETLQLGLDTYRADLGESVLQGGATVKNRCEFDLQVTTGSAQLFVTRAYNTMGIWHHDAADDQLFHSTATDGQAWDLLRWQNGGEHRGLPGSQVFPATYFDAGNLRVGTGGTLDAVRFEGNTIHIQLPWTYLNVADPSTGSVLDDDRHTPLTTETATSDGLAMTVVLGGDRLETPRYVWPTWNQAPPTTEREKAGLPIFMRAVQALTDLR